MKYLVVFFLVLTISTLTNAQIITSSCVGVDSAVANYNETAYYRAYNHYSARSHDYFIDSIPIYDTMKNKYLDALMAIYNTTGIERDSIFVYHKIKSFFCCFSYSDELF